MPLQLWGSELDAILAERSTRPLLQLEGDQLDHKRVMEPLTDVILGRIDVPCLDFSINVCFVTSDLLQDVSGMLR